MFGKHMDIEFNCVLFNLTSLSIFPSAMVKTYNIFCILVKQTNKQTNTIYGYVLLMQSTEGQRSRCVAEKSCYL